MDDKSPYGGLQNLVIRGTQQDAAQSISLHVTAEFVTSGDCRDIFPIMPGAFRWNGVDTAKYKSFIVSTGDRVELEITYAHTAGKKEIQLSPVLFFGSHGWVKLETRMLVLDREDRITYNLPLDVAEDNIDRRSSGDRKRVALEAVYGMSLVDRGPSVNAVRPSVSPRKRRWFDVEKDAVHDDEHYVASKMLCLEDTERLYMEKKEKDRVLVETVLIPKWKDALVACVKGLLGSPSRVRTIIRKWNSSPPFPRGQVVSSFIQAFLSSTVSLTITDSHVYLFSNRALAIQRAWLTFDESALFNKLVVERETLFNPIERGVGSQYTLTGFKLDQVIREVICGRFIVQQYALDLVKTGLDTKDPSLIFALITGVSRCHVQNKKDPFLARLVTATETNRIFNDIQALGMFVSIGGEKPMYEFHVPDRSSSVGNLPMIPHTPFRLATPK